jgi:hypothetical protein
VINTIEIVSGVLAIITASMWALRIERRVRLALRLHYISAKYSNNALLLRILCENENSSCYIIQYVEENEE